METTVSLVQMLDARERRVQHQQELLARYHKPLICFTMNICGPIKDSPLIRRGFARGRASWRARRAVRTARGRFQAARRLCARFRQKQLSG